MKKFIILIPPSEGKKTGGDKPKIKKTAEIAEIIDRISKADPQKLYSGTEKSIQEAVTINEEITKSKTMPGIKRYTGVVYDAINYENLKNKSYFNTHVRIISGLFGLVAPTELIPNYKLKMSKLGLAKFWKPIISEQLKDVFIIDLLPQEHKAAVTYENGIEVEFIITKQGKKKPAGHFGKYVKGTFVRWLVENKVTDIKEIKAFSAEGFSFKEQIDNTHYFEKKE